MSKPYAESCEQHREPILDVLRGIFADRQRHRPQSRRHRPGLERDAAMQANNRTLVWRRRP